jgi:hypothetical protein
MHAEATLTIESAWKMSGGIVPMVRVVPHDSEGRKPRGKKALGIQILAPEGKTHADVLRTIADYLEQEGGDWSKFSKDNIERKPADE